jgi:hypothetical protein
VALSDFATVLISLSKQPLSRAGFGIPLIAAPDCPAGFTQRVRVYNTPDDLIDDGFAATGPTYLLASVLMSQEQAPTSFKVGRLANKPTQKFTLTPVVGNTTEYAGTLNGVRWTYTSDGSATAAEIVAGVHTAIAAVATAQSKSFTFTENSTTLDVLAGAAGTQFDSFAVENVDVLGIAQVHADPGVAADLAAIATEDGDFYGVLNAFNSKAMAAAIAGWVETQGGLKQFFADTNDSSHCTVAVGSATDLGTTLKTAADDYTGVLYSPANGEFLGAALCGLLLPEDPGSENWAMQTPAVSPSKLTATHRANLVAKNVTFCEVLGGENNTFEGKVASGKFIDTVRFRAWLQVNIQADVIGAVKARAPKKLPFTDAGIAVIGAAIQGVLNRGVKVGGLTDDPAPYVTLPKLTDVPDVDRQARVLSGVSFFAQLGGAINKVIPVKGQLAA